MPAGRERRRFRAVHTVKADAGRSALQTTLVYTVVAALWITFSDWVLMKFVSDRALVGELAMFKGWAFVVVTAALLYGIILRCLRRVEIEAAARVETEAELRRWADAFEHCAHGIALGNPATQRIIACNPAFARMHGYTVGEMVGCPGSAMYDQADHELLKRNLARSDETGHAQYEIRVRRKDGRHFDALVDVVSVRDDGGKLLYHVVTKQDVTHRKHAAAALRESDEVLRKVIDLVPHFIFAKDEAGRLLFVNNAFAEAHGMKPEQMIGLTDRDFVRDKTEAGAFIRDDQEVISSGRTKFVPEEKLRGADGRLRLLQTIKMQFMLPLTGRPALMGVAVDITEAKRVEAALRESEERFRAVVENIHEIFWMVAADKSRLLYVSPSYAEIWGRSCESLYAAPESWLESVHTEDRERVRSAAKTKILNGDYDEQYRVVQANGSERWVRDRGFPIRGKTGEIERIVGVAEDITERKRLEAQFLRAQRMEAIGMLAGGVAHDLNNILAPMLMAASLLKENVTDPHDREMLTMVESSARRGAEIIRQLLTFSRGADGARLPVQIRHLLKEMGAIVRETFPREIKLVEENPREVWPVIADATQLHQVLVNLCVNARDAMPDGGTLTLRTENVTLSEAEARARPEAKPGVYVALTVSDTGSGMTPEIIERIFDPFFTTKEPGKGTGLGLPTVLTIVRGHHGFMTVTSAPGRGSAFKIFLPAAPGEAETEEAETNRPFPAGAGELILVVDDEAPIRASIQQALQKYNFRVLTAANGKEAITKFLNNRERVRLVLTDAMMPEMGGAALVRALRLLDPQLKFIVTSGLGSESNDGEFATLGVKEILPKPCGPKALLEAVRRALG